MTNGWTVSQVDSQKGGQSESYRQTDVQPDTTTDKQMDGQSYKQAAKMDIRYGLDVLLIYIFQFLLPQVREGCL
jgi:hypothetical protein